VHIGSGCWSSSGTDGKRHVFPNERAYFTWFANYDDMKIVSGDVLASFALGKNVTYRPGVKMVKFQADPAVYIVSQFSVLHWVPSEAMAAQLYGSNWNARIDDISDAFLLQLHGRHRAHERRRLQSKRRNLRRDKPFRKLLGMNF
jgi:hypothetical protein